MTRNEQPDDPNRLHPRPDFPQQDQEPPGRTGPMDPPPDHGEESYRGSGLLTDRKTVITGGDSGIGRAVALALAREGADVLLTHLAEEEQEARETARLVEEADRTAVTVPCDIRDEKQCRALVERAVSDFGRIDVLVNNAAYQMSQPDGISAISTEQFDRVVRTNLYGMFWLSKFALPHIPAGGSVINTTSVQAYKPSPHLLDYAMTKGAIVTFTQGLAQMPASDGIRVNAVARGPSGRHSSPRPCRTPRSSGSRARWGVRRSRPRWRPPMSSSPPPTPRSSRARS